MTQQFSRLCLLSLAILLTGCAATSNGYDYTALKQSKPRSRLVLPPLNNSPDIRASYSFLSTVTAPLAESGYYVFPVALVDQTFKENGLPNPGEMHQAPLAKMAEIFGADAALFITIDQYGSVYQILDSSVIVTANARLMDTRTGQLLWEGKASASSAEGQNNSGGGLVGVLVSALVKQIVGSIGDQGHSIARITSARLLTAHKGGLLHGPRSPLYEKD
jgi:hypothetical protein